MDLDLSGDAALVTGGSSGLGLGSAVALAREDADVAVCARNADRLEQARERIDAAGDGDVLALQADVTDDQGDVARLIDGVIDDFGGLDHLVVSTGGPRDTTLLGAEEHDWYVGYDLLVTSVYRLLRQGYEDLADGGGSLTVVSCTTAREARAGRALENALCRAAVGLVETAALELAPEIRANAVLAGPHDTPYFAERMEGAVERGDADSADEARAAIESEIPLGRVGDPDDFGSLVAFLASDRAQFVTGAAVPVDGGLTRS